jgi:hypothetical protein
MLRNEASINASVDSSCVGMTDTNGMLRNNPFTNGTYTVVMLRNEASVALPYRFLLRRNDRYEWYAEKQSLY